MPRLPMRSGQVLDGIELLLPIADWSNADVMAYLAEVGAPVSTAYQHFANLPECATCSAWWNEGRAAYLREHHPELFHVYRTRMAAVLEAVGPVTAAMASELKELGR
jgi:3'-phosphoadenosine 5'-phosphosulfate sulfotransferase (PAPS reductase)/FAD synthetase